MKHWMAVSTVVFLLCAGQAHGQSVVKGTGADATLNSEVGKFADARDGTPVSLAVLPLAFNNATWDRLRSTSAGNLAASLNTGAFLTEKGPRWSVISNPAAGSQATASKAAIASTRHVADCISFSAGSTTAPALTALKVNLRDGATGAGTIIWTYQVVIPAATGQNVATDSVCGLGLVGSVNTAMTLEFSAALANLVQAVSVSGYDVQ